MSQPGPARDLHEELPEAYATLLEMRATGASDAEIAARLDVPVESVPTLDAIARRKLSNRPN